MMTVMTMMVCIRFMFYKSAINDESFPDYLVGKESACNSGDIEDPGLIPGLGRSPGREHGNPLQYCCLENPMDRGACWAIVHAIRESELTERLSMQYMLESTLMMKLERGSGTRLIPRSRVSTFPRRIGEPGCFQQGVCLCSPPQLLASPTHTPEKIHLCPNPRESMKVTLFG